MPSSPKTLLLFTIRDHTVTPLESLEATLRTDMAKIFDELPRVRPGQSQ